MSFIWASLILMPVGQGFSSSTAVAVRPVLVVTAAMVARMTWWLVSGRPRQARVIWENSRCSIWGEMRTSAGVRQRAGA
jgi:hypothetical protein